MAGTAFGLPQLLSLYDPSVAVDQTALERQMALAQAIRQQALTPINTQGRQIGGMGYRISPLEGVAKVLQAYQANRMDQQNDAARLDLMQRMGQAYAAALRGGAPGDQSAPTVGTQAPAPVTDASAPNGGLPAGVTPAQMEAGGFPQPAQSAPSVTSSAPPPASSVPSSAPSMGMPDRFSMANVLRGGIISSLGGDAAGAAYWENSKIPDAVKTLYLTGQNPQTVGDLTTGKLRKEANAPTRLGPNAYADNSGTVHFVPDTIEGSINIPDPNVPGGFRTVPVPGGSNAMYAKEAAKAGAKAAFTPYAGFDSGGHPAPLTSVASALRNYGGGASSPGVATVTPVPGQGPSATAMDSRLYGAQPLGTESEQKTIDTEWKRISDASTQAQTTSSYLDNIVKAAKNGAIIGPNADRREMIQGFLQLAGIKESVNENAVSQTQLLDKYHNQIVTRLGQAGLGTDAARALLDTAYPGKAMNISALEDAAANLKGANDMSKAEAAFLQPSKIARDSAGFQQRQLAFEQNADPRIWQWAAIQNPDARKAFLQQTMQQDPTFLDRVKKLREIGALR